MLPDNILDQFFAYRSGVWGVQLADDGTVMVRADVGPLNALDNIEDRAWFESREEALAWGTRRVDELVASRPDG